MSLGSIPRALGSHKASKSRQKAAKFRQRIAFGQSLIKRRTFLRNARAALATNLVGGVATGASLDSSAFQGVQASIATQREAALDVFNEAARNEKKARSADKTAASSESFGQIAGAVVDFAGSVAGGT